MAEKRWQGLDANRGHPQPMRQRNQWLSISASLSPGETILRRVLSSPTCFRNRMQGAMRHAIFSVVQGFFFRQDKALKPKRIPGFKAQILVKQSFHVPQNPGASSKKHPTWETTLFMVGLLRKKFRLKIAN